MPKFTKPWKAIVPGDKYERDFFAGEDCPKDLVKQAEADGVVPVKVKKKAKNA